MNRGLDLRSKVKAFDDIFKSSSDSNNAEDILYISLDRLEPFPNHPFRQYTGSKLDNMVESIKKYGVLTPIIIRPVGNRFQILSGHNRVNASNLAGLSQIRAIKIEVDDDTAAIIVVETNFRQRDDILPSERAFAYKMKLEAMKRRGKRLDLLDDDDKGRKSRDILGDEIGESGYQVRRYIRLTELIPEFLDMADENKFGFNVWVEMSYLKKEEQVLVYEIIKEQEIKLILSQVSELKKISKIKLLSREEIVSVLVEKKVKNKVIKFKVNDLKKYFPDECESEDILKIIIEALEAYTKK